MSLTWEKIPGPLSLFPYCKRWKPGWDLGTRLLCFGIEYSFLSYYRSLEKYCLLRYLFYNVFIPSNSVVPAGLLSSCLDFRAACFLTCWWIETLVLSHHGLKVLLWAVSRAVSYHSSMVLWTCHRAKNNISHLSCGHEIWHFIDCFPPIL